MFVSTFHRYDDNKQRILIDLTKVEAIKEFEYGTELYTASNQYAVSEPYAEVIEWFTLAIKHSRTTKIAKDNSPHI